MSEWSRSEESPSVRRFRGRGDGVSQRRTRKGPVDTEGSTRIPAGQERGGDEEVSGSGSGWCLSLVVPRGFLPSKIVVSSCLRHTNLSRFLLAPSTFPFTTLDVLSVGWRKLVSSPKLVGSAEVFASQITQRNCRSSSRTSRPRELTLTSAYPGEVRTRGGSPLGVPVEQRRSHRGEKK